MSYGPAILVIIGAAFLGGGIYRGSTMTVVLGGVFLFLAGAFAYG